MGGDTLTGLNMSEYKATEQELFAALLSIRNTKWDECSASACDKRAGEIMYGRGGYERFMNFTSKENYSEILGRNFRSVMEWKELSFAVILKEIKGSTDDCHIHLLWLTERYLMAVKHKLLDIVYKKRQYSGYNRDYLKDPERRKPVVVEPSSEQIEEAERHYNSLNERYKHLEGTEQVKLEDIASIVPCESDGNESRKPFLSDEHGATFLILTEEVLIRKMLPLQELKQLLSDMTQQAATPAAGQQETNPGRKEKLSMDTFQREIYPELNKQFPRGQKIRPGIKKACQQWGLKYGVSESTIRRDFDKQQNMGE